MSGFSFCDLRLHSIDIFANLVSDRKSGGRVLFVPYLKKEGRMYFAGYVTKKGMLINNVPNLMEVVLYNGRKVIIRGPAVDVQGPFNPGDLLKFYADGNEGTSNIDLERDQPEGKYYTVSYTYCSRVTDENTIRTFFIGAKIFAMFTVPIILL